MPSGRVALAGATVAVGAAAMAAVVVASTVYAVLHLGTIGAGPGAGAGAATADGNVGDIPAPYLGAMDRAGARFGVSWSVLAGIYRVECDFGRSLLPGCPRGTRNAFGAQGPGQFLPQTWDRSTTAGAILVPGPPVADGLGWATDGDGDGVADPWNPADAVASTARLLAADGAATDVSSAIFGYNHDTAYVRQVLALAAGYERRRAALVGSAGPAGATTPGAGVGAVLAFARAQLGLPYRWGGSGPQTWDCSGLVQAAYATAGVQLTHDAAAQEAATAGHAVAPGALVAGDLVFYGASAATIHHVGIAVDATHMIDAPFTGAVVRVDPVAAPDLLAATRPLG